MDHGEVALHAAGVHSVFAALDGHACLSPSSAQAEHLAICRVVSAGIGEIVEGALGDADDVPANEFGALSRAVLGVLQRAFPFEHCPAIEIIGGELREDAGEINLPVARCTETPSSVHPALIAAIDTLPSGRVELGVLHME